ncbi:MAG: 4Fe-4S binding protein [Lachnospiraceae bacterium]
MLQRSWKILQHKKHLNFRGNRPYRQYGGVPFKPIVNKKCTSCGLCAKECPTGAISLDDPKITDNDKCISCMHCVAVCQRMQRTIVNLSVL